MPVPVPDRFDDITTEWFAGALDEGGVHGGTVTDVEVELLPPEAGLLGDVAKVHVTFEDHEACTFVVKLPAADPAGRRVGEMLAAYAREVAFYRHVAPATPDLRVPRCFYAGEDLDARRWALVLEAIDADDIDFAVGASTAQAESTVDALADFHATWWQSPRTFDWMPGFDTTGVGGLQPLWLTNLPTFVERYGEVLPGRTADWVLEFAPGLAAWSERAAREPITMVHTDCRVDNLLFSGGDITIIDWQTALRGPAAMDLTCFLATSLSVELRREHEGELIDRYLDRLGERDVAVDHDWFRRSFDENLLWWMGQFGNNLAHLEPKDARVAANLRVMVERIYTAALDHDVDRLL